MKTFLNKFVFISIILLAASFSLASSSESSNFSCEVMALQGNVDRESSDGSHSLLKVGDIILEGDLIDVKSGSSADVSYDKDWNNVVRFEEGTKVKISSVFPAKMLVKDGGVFAKLKKLPTGSTFEVQTPTAIAAVRGTEYRTTVTYGETQVYNFSSSLVQVYGVDASGAQSGEPVILAQSQKTNVSASGKPPEPALIMSSEESQKGQVIQKSLEVKVKEVIESGRSGKIQDISALELEMTKPAPNKPEGESRVNDARRRQFKSN